MSQLFDTKSNGVFDGNPHFKSHRIGTPSLSTKARAAQAQQVGQGVGFDVEVKVEKKNNVSQWFQKLIKSSVYLYGCFQK